MFSKIIDINNPTARTTDEFKNTPLIAAVAYDQKELAFDILEKFPNHKTYINLQDDCKQTGCGNTALLLAIMRGHKDLAIKLIELGADVNIANNDGSTPLHYACIFRDYDLINALVKQGARFDVQNHAGFTPENFLTYDFTGLHKNSYMGRSIREIEVLLEHREHDWKPGLRDRDKEKNYNIHETGSSIAQKISTVANELVKNISISYIINHKKNFDTHKDVLQILYPDFEALQKDWSDIRTEIVKAKKYIGKEDAEVQRLIKEKLTKALEMEYVKKYAVGLDEKHSLPRTSVVTHSVFHLAPSPTSEPHSSLTRAQEEEIRQLIAALTQEIAEPSKYKDIDRKKSKKAGLEKLIRLCSEKDIVSAITQVESEFKDIRKGFLDRTSKLLDELKTSVKKSGPGGSHY